MSTKITAKPDHFASPTEESYWHEAQHIAYRAGCATEVRGWEVFLVFDASSEFLGRLLPWLAIWSWTQARIPTLYIPAYRRKNLTLAPRP